MKTTSRGGAEMPTEQSSAMPAEASNVHRGSTYRTLTGQVKLHSLGIKNTSRQSKAASE